MQKFSYPTFLCQLGMFINVKIHPYILALLSLLQLLFTPWGFFFTSVLADGFHWSLGDSKSPQVSRTLLSILTVLHNALVWIVSTWPPIFKSSRPFNNPLVTVPKSSITIDIIVTFMSHSVFRFPTKSRYFSFFSHSFSFILWPTGTAKFTILQILFFFFFLLIIITSGFLAEIKWSVCKSKSHRSLYVIF